MQGLLSYWQQQSIHLEYPQCLQCVKSLHCLSELRGLFQISGSCHQATSSAQKGNKLKTMQENKVHMSDCALKALELRTLQLFGGFPQSLAGLSLKFQFARYKQLVGGVMYSQEVLLVLFRVVSYESSWRSLSWQLGKIPGPWLVVTALPRKIFGNLQASLIKWTSVQNPWWFS